MKIKITIEEIGNSFNQAETTLNVPAEFNEFVEEIGKVTKKVFNNFVKSKEER